MFIKLIDIFISLISTTNYKNNTLLLSKKINKIYFEDRFSLFEISNFLNEEIYNELNLTYPEKSLFSEHNDFARSFTCENDNFSNFLEQNPQWQNFINEINSKVFVEDLIKLFNLKNVYFSENSWKRKIKIFKKVKLSFCFNISEEGGFTLPHTDSSRKLVSMIIFFVDGLWNEKNGGQVKLYKPINSVHENNWRNEKVDEKHLKVVKTIIPAPNKIYGFKKTKNSYHSVETVKENDSLKRKVFMINLIYENASDSPYFEKKSRLKKFKNIIKGLLVK